MSRFPLAALLPFLLVVPVEAQSPPAAVAATPVTKQDKKAKPAAKPASTPVGLLKLSGAYADFAEGAPDLASMLMGGGVKPKPFYHMVGQLREFAKDEKAKEMLLDLTTGFSMNPVQVAEMERCLRAVRKSGKKLYAYLEVAGSVQMQIAAQCDHVILADMGLIDMPSIALTVTFMKDALDLLGVKMDVVRCGDFKGAVEPYLLSGMSKHLRKHYLAMIGKINDDVVRRIASGRRISQGTVRELQERRLITAKQALAAGLVDELVPWVGANRALAKVTGKKDVSFKNVVEKKKRKSLNFFTLMGNILNPKKASAAKIDKGVVVLHLSGGIIDGAKASPGSIVSGPTVKTIRQITSNKNVQAVVVRVNSPGGSATASEAILLALRDLANAKPVVFSMGRVAASGGYYVTCIGRPIFAEAGTITGSIGVFGMKPSLGALMRRVGIHEEIVGLDEGVEMMSLEKSWSSEHKAVMQGFVNEVYDRFTSHVGASRQMPVTEVLKIAGGRVWSGEQAVTNGLVDRIGGLDAALALVAKEAELGEDYNVSHLPEPTDMMDALMQDLVGAKTLLSDSLLQRIAGRTGRLDSALRVLLDALTSEQPTRVWMMLSESIEIR